MHHTDAENEEESRRHSSSSAEAMLPNHGHQDAFLGDVACGAQPDVEDLKQVPDFCPRDGRVLHAYQLEGINWMRRKHHEGASVILADESGLGRTVQIALFLGSIPRERPFLVVVPLATTDNWQTHLESWCPHLNTLVYQGDSKDRKAARALEFDPDGLGVPMFDVLCVAHETYLTDDKYFKEFSWEVLVVDEMHRRHTDNAR
jgi:SNF2 family DNA or RNA helicase